MDEIVFGSNTYRQNVLGMSVPEATDRMSHLCFFKSGKNPINILLGGLPAKLNLLQSQREAESINVELRKQIIADYESRVSRPLESLGESVLDLMAKHNKTCASEERLSHDEIIGNCIIFHVAGVDTSKSCLEFVIQHLARDVACQERFRTEIVKDIAASKQNRYETYAENSTLKYFTKECLRIFGPVAAYFPRVATKDFRAGSYTIFKGTRYIGICSSFHHGESYFKNAKQFEFDRFKDESERQKPGTLIPFGLGKRNCIGKYFGELMIQIVLVKLFSKFELSALPDYEVTAVLGLTYGIDSCFAYANPIIN